MIRTIGKQSVESMELDLLKKKNKATVGRIYRKGKFKAYPTANQFHHTGE